MPATIDDAISVRQKLGERHLWVDDLCIIQDDVENKADEISMMDLTYSSAFLNVVAAAGDHADFGLAGVSRLERSTTPKKAKLRDCEIVQVLPSLSQAVDSSAWNARG